MRSARSSGDLQDAHELAPVVGLQSDLDRDGPLDAASSAARRPLHGGRGPLRLPRVALIHVAERHGFQVSQQVALQRGGGLRRIQHRPVLAPQGAVIEEIGDPLQAGALQAVGIGPAVARQRHHRLRGAGG